MATFQIQNSDGTRSSVSHDEFFEILNGKNTYLYYKQGGIHLAMLPNPENEETIRLCHQAENTEYEASNLAARCRDEKGQPCRYQHDASGRVIRNKQGNAVRAKCGDCPRDGWIAGKRENCCIRNHCKTADCAHCKNYRQFNAPYSLEHLPTDKRENSEIEDAGLNIADPNVNIQTALENDELQSALHTAIRLLPPNEQAVLKSIYWSKLSQRAFAVQSGLSRSVVKRLHDRALESLKSLLKNFR